MWLKELGPGINLGQRFEAVDKSRDADDVKLFVTKAWAAGFRHVRIPVTWCSDAGKDFTTANEGFMKPLRYAVACCVEAGMRVILDAHHEKWLHDGFDDSPATLAKFTQLWKTIATLFKAVSTDKLAFEILNEPRNKFGEGTSYDQALFLSRTRKINQAGYDGVRAVSAKRIVFVQPNNWGSLYGASVVYPARSSLPGGGADDKVAVSVHTYVPTDFCLPDGSNSYFGSDADVVALLTKRAKALKRWSDASSVPVHVGEFGVGAQSGSRRDSAVVKLFYKETAKQFAAVGIPVCVWDDAGYFCVISERGDYKYGLANQVIAGWREGSNS